jgi:hypothetical protein
MFGHPRGGKVPVAVGMFNLNNLFSRSDAADALGPHRRTSFRPSAPIPIGAAADWIEDHTDLLDTKAKKE